MAKIVIPVVIMICGFMTLCIGWLVYGTPASFNPKYFLSSNLNIREPVNDLKASGSEGILFTKYFIAYSSELPGSLKAPDGFNTDAPGWEKSGLQNMFLSDNKTAIARCKTELLSAFPDEKNIIEDIGPFDYQSLSCYSSRQQADSQAVILSNKTKMRHYLYFSRNYCPDTAGEEH